jgi:type I restriction enzyme S subunit
MREFGSGMRFRNGDALLARITPCLENGKAAYVDYLADGEVGWGSTEFIVLRATPPLPKPLAYLLTRQQDFRKHAIRSMTGTSGRQRAQETAIGQYRIAVADTSIYSALGEFLGAFFAKIKSNANENKTLAETRDYLLPKFMSGQMRVREAEALAESSAWVTTIGIRARISLVFRDGRNSSL